MRRQTKFYKNEDDVPKYRTSTAHNEEIRLRYLELNQQLKVYRTSERRRHDVLHFVQPS